MSLEFKLNLNDFEKALKNQPEKVYNYLRIANKRVGSEMEQEARSNHPTWTSRSGDLKDSIKYFYTSRQGKSVELKLVLLDKATHPLGTEYGKWQHDGTMSKNGKVKLKGDKWVERAFKNNLGKLEKEWQEAIDKANKEF